MDSDKEIGFYRGYALYCDEKGDFSAKKTSETREYQSYNDLDDLKEDIKSDVTKGENNEDNTILIACVCLLAGMGIGVLAMYSNLNNIDNAVSSLNSSLNKCLEEKQEPIILTKEDTNCLFRTEPDIFKMTMVDTCLSDCDRLYGPTAVMLCQKGCEKR